MTTILSLLTNIMFIINSYLVPLIFAVAFIMFLFGILRGFFLNPGDAKKREEGKQFALWAIIAFFVMFSVWGLVNILFWSFGLNNDVRPAIPSFGTTGTTNTSGLFNMSANTSNTTVQGNTTQTTGNCPSGSTYVANYGIDSSPECVSLSTGQPI